MAVYIDNFNAKYGRMIMCHMIADTTDELLDMADKIGVQRKWIQDKDTPNEHFDVALTSKAKGIAAGAIEINFREYAKRVNDKCKALGYNRFMDWAAANEYNILKK
jgi:hypothetical protein